MIDSGDCGLRHVFKACEGAVGDNGTKPAGLRRSEDRGGAAKGEAVYPDSLRIDFQPRFQIPEGSENVLLLAVTEGSTASAARSVGAKVEQEYFISPAREGSCELGKIRFVRADAVADDDGRRRRVWKGRLDEPAREFDAVVARENDVL